MIFWILIKQLNKFFNLEYIYLINILCDWSKTLILLTLDWFDRLLQNWSLKKFNLAFTAIGKIDLIIYRFFSFPMFFYLLNAHIFLRKYVIQIMILLLKIFECVWLFIQNLLRRMLIWININEFVVMINIIKMNIGSFSLNNLFILLFNFNILDILNCFLIIRLILWVIQNRLFKWRVIINVLVLLLLGFKFKINAAKLLF